MQWRAKKLQEYEDGGPLKKTFPNKRVLELWMRNRFNEAMKKRRAWGKEGKEQEEEEAVEVEDAQTPRVFRKCMCVYFILIFFSCFALIMLWFIPIYDRYSSCVDIGCRSVGSCKQQCTHDLMTFGEGCTVSCEVVLLIPNGTELVPQDSSRDNATAVTLPSPILFVLENGF